MSSKYVFDVEEHTVPHYTKEQRLEIAQHLYVSTSWHWIGPVIYDWSHTEFYEKAYAHGFRASSYGQSHKAINSEEGKNKELTEAQARRQRELQIQHAHDAAQDAAIAYEDFKKTWWIHIAGLAFSSGVAVAGIGVAMVSTWWIGLITMLMGFAIFIGATVTVCQRYFNVHGQDHKRNIRVADRKVRDLLTND